MTISNNTLTKGFIIGGITNSSVLLFSRLFTNPTIAEHDPVVMSNFGLLMIIVWGLAYISVAKKFYEVKWLVGVFVIEKLIYGCIWINWHLNHSISTVFEQDTFAGVFLSVYGVNDWLFFFFFLYVFVRLVKTK